MRKFRHIILAGLVSSGAGTLTLFASDAETPYLDSLVLTQIFQHADLSNSDLIELASQSHAMKNSSEDLMVSRLKSWLSDDEKRRIESEALSLYPALARNEHKIHRHYVKYFHALEKAWQSEVAEPSYQMIARGYHTKIVDFDPYNQNRLLLKVSRQNNQELYLVDTASQQSFILHAPAAINTAHFVPNEPNKVLVLHGQGLSVMDVLDPTAPTSELITNETFTRVVIPPGSNAAAMLSLGFTWWSVKKDEYGDWELFETSFPSMQKPVEHILTSVDYPGVVFIVTNNTINIWNPELANDLKTIAIGSNAGWKSIFLHEKKRDTVTVLSSSGVVSNYTLSTGKKTAERSLGPDCGRLRESAALSANGERFVVSCWGEHASVVDAHTLKPKGNIKISGARTFLKALGGRSPYAVSWDNLARKIALIDTQKPEFAGYITRNCGAKLSLKVFSCLRPNPVLPVELQDVALNPWDSHRILTTNGIELTIWDTQFKKPRTIHVFDAHLDSATDIVLHPHNPNKVYLLKSGRWLAVIDFMKGAKKLVKSSIE
jgi:hypothetical protein